ncbi:hypothetical protein [Sulfitobacter sp. PS-8MA]|uniref:hypothetical protein n=1 Tax=Sulfitobacter sp. PS-8MA TaxID=3237707 RepID=UPI0034C5EFCA
MTSLSHRYHDFGTSAAGDAEGAIAEAVQDEKLQSFEAGYQAGWDDAVKAHTTDRDRAASETAQSLQDMSFTYHEVQRKLLDALHPLLRCVVAKVLPVAAHATLAEQVVELLGKMLADNAEGGIEIVVAPEQMDAMQETLSQKIKLPFLLTAEPTLSPGQVYLRANAQEREINLDTVLLGLSDALDAFFLQSRQETSRG